MFWALCACLERRKWVCAGVVRCEGPRAGTGVWCRKEIGFQKVPPLDCGQLRCLHCRYDGGPALAQVGLAAEWL